MNRASFDLDCPAAGPSGDQSLTITFGPDVHAPSRDHALLVAFHFGAAPNRSQPGIVSPGLVPIDGNDLYECWWHNGRVDHWQAGDIAVAGCEDYTVVTLQRKDVPPDHFRALTYEAYLDLFDTLGMTEHTQVAKIWNYFSGINEGNEDSEKYRQFSMGRAEAFEEIGIRDNNVPCGTAVGGSSCDLSIIALASKHEFRSAENPRQVSAYLYPKQYGPKSPKFSRGGCIGGRVFVLSGTAAIVGHESAHPYETRRQIDETLENLNQLSKALSEHCEASELLLDRDYALRVYLRDPKDLQHVADRLADQIGINVDNVAFLRADICRRELMVEIDGVKVA
jgi:chorismate lyase/3-hydroxybenzoate synthase